MRSHESQRDKFVSKMCRALAKNRDHRVSADEVLDMWMICYAECVSRHHKHFTGTDKEFRTYLWNSVVRKRLGQIFDPVLSTKEKKIRMFAYDPENKKYGYYTRIRNADDARCAQNANMAKRRQAKDLRHKALDERQLIGRGPMKKWRDKQKYYEWEESNPKLFSPADLIAERRISHEQFCQKDSQEQKCQEV